MRYTLLFIGVTLLVALTFVSAEHHGKSAGAGSQIEAEDQKAHHAKKSGKKFNHDHEKAQKGKSEVVFHKKEEAEKGGKKHHSIDEGSHKAQNHNQGHGSHGAAFKHGDHKKKSRLEKGFREQYHKDEHKKSDSWFSNKHQSGEWLKFGSGKAKHHVAKHDKDSRGKYQNGKSGEKHGKEQKYAEGHAKADHKGHQSQHGGQSHFSKHEEHGKKKLHGHGK